jgi:hypothetical protein
MRPIVLLLLLLPAVAISEMVIELKDGGRIVLPVEKKDIRRITYNPSESPQTTSRGTGASNSGPTVWRVGKDRSLKFPSDAAKVAQSGDTIEIDAGVYHNDYVRWAQDDLTIRGVGGMAHLKSKGLIPNRKAIWIIRGQNTTIENIEFSGAAVRDRNGAGIRHEANNLKLHNTFFHNNEFSILIGKRPDSEIDISSSRFWFQQREGRFSHGIYIGQVKRLTITGSHFKGTDQGHQIKTRALENHILYNRIEDVPGGNSSRLIELSNCGLGFVIGNELHQAETATNRNIIGYGPEGCERRTERQMRLYVINNTLVNEADSATFVNNHAGGDVLVANNLVFGEAEMLQGDGDADRNVRMPLQERPRGSWFAPAGSDAIDAALPLKSRDGASLLPDREFAEPAGTRERLRAGVLDVGAREAGK